MPDQGFLLGALQQVINQVTRTVPLPIVIRGDVFEPQGTGAHSGADFVDRLLGAVRAGARSATSPARTGRPLVAAATLTIPAVPAGAPPRSTRLTFRAQAPGNSWEAAGRESALVAVYVDGVYHSTVPVLSERGDGRYSLNLGSLTPGTHAIELRSANDRAGATAAPARVSEIAAEQTGGDQALIDLHAPIIESRALQRDADGRLRSPLSHTDVPLLLVPSLTTNRDGTRTIEYKVAFPNEDGGTKTDDLYSRYGRGIDYEWAYRVTVDRAGRRISAAFQAPLHRTMAFAGTYVGERPVLRVSTENNTFSQRPAAQGEVDRWSEAPIAPIAPTTTEVELLARHPWTTQVMARELVREGKVDSGLPNAIADPRRYLYVHAATDAARAALKAGTELVLRLRGGERMSLSVAAAGGYGTATTVLLPAAIADAIEGVEGLASAFVLGSDYRARALRVIPKAH